MGQTRLDEVSLPAHKVTEHPFVIEVHNYTEPGPPRLQLQVCLLTSGCCLCSLAGAQPAGSFVGINSPVVTQEHSRRVAEQSWECIRSSYIQAAVRTRRQHR